MTPVTQISNALADITDHLMHVRQAGGNEARARCADLVADLLTTSLMHGLECPELVKLSQRLASRQALDLDRLEPLLAAWQAASTAGA